MHPTLRNALKEYDEDRLTTQMIAPLADHTNIRLVRLCVLGKGDGTLLAVRCVAEDASRGERETSVTVIERAVASLPAGEPAPAEIINEVLASDIGTIVMLALFKNEIDAWVRLLLHHPRLTKEHAFYLARELVGDGGRAFGPS